MDIMLSLYDEGYDCAQILMRLVLDAEEKENPDLIRTLAGLNGGIGGSGHTCGCMTGGACIISYVTGKGSDTDMDSPEHKGAMAEFTNWFKEEMTVNYGGTDCEDITKGNPARRVELCPGIIADTYQKCMEILSDRGLL